MQAILPTTLEEGLEARELVGLRCDHDLSADFVGDVVGLAELDHLADAADGEVGSERTGFVVEAAVDDSAVVAALVTGDGGLLFEDGDVDAGELLLKSPGGGESDDASADDGNARGH